jgi:hypothetical protein
MIPSKNYQKLLLTARLIYNMSYSCNDIQYQNCIVNIHPNNFYILLIYSLTLY